MRTFVHLALFSDAGLLVGLPLLSFYLESGAVVVFFHSGFDLHFIRLSFAYSSAAHVTYVPWRIKGFLLIFFNLSNFVLVDIVVETTICIICNMEGRQGKAQQQQPQ